MIGDRGDDTGTAEGADILYGGDGDDQLQGGLGDDILHGEKGADILFGQEGNDLLYGGSEDDQLQGNDGDDVLYGGDGSDTLFGDDGDDTLYGGDGDDILLPGAGNDTLDGGSGNDIYFFENGSGVKHLTDSGGDDLLVLNGMSLSNIKLSKGSLMISSRDAGGALHLDGVDYDNLVETSPIDRIRFSGGEEMSIAEVIQAVGIDYETTEGADTVTGTSARDNITALGGDDVVHTGAGNDIIDLGAGDDIADAGSGDDYLDGGQGIDTLIGGTGDDFYRVDHAEDRIIEAAGEGYDRVESEVNYTLSEHVEQLTLNGSSAFDGAGNQQDNRIVGNANDNRLEGLAGNDILDGRDGADQLLGGDGEDLLIGGGGDDLLDGGAGADIMQGGSGDDLYRVDDKNDQIDEGSNQGYDRVESSASYRLDNNLEELQLTGTENLGGWGNDADNRIIGNTGDNYLDGLGGDDVLEGGEGNDTYRIDTPGDSVLENAGEGVDTVEAGFDYTLGDHVENLVLTGTARNGTGNDLDNHLVGNSAANRLDGGSGADLLEGGAGNDTYVVDQENDQILEAVYGGTDEVQSSVSYTLADNVENLTLTGSGDLNGTGNDLNNRIFGNEGSNVLSGAAGSDALFGLGGEDRLYGGAGNDMLDGGTGADLMAGGIGNDSYYVDSEADQIVEYAGQGIDQVLSTVSHTLSDNVENLTLTGSDHIDGVGNALDNEIIGNWGSNTLIGEAGDDFLDGGYGSDILVGGTGDDIYRVDRAGDIVVEEAGEGYDQVESEVSYILSDHVEELSLIGSQAFDGTGNAQDNRIIGNSLDNNLDGREGNDYLDGGAGDDNLLGGMGDDILYGGDDELSGGGDDPGPIYYFSANKVSTASISNGVQSNNDYLDGGVGNDDLDGGSGDDVLFGGEGDDILYGGDDGLNGGGEDPGGSEDPGGPYYFAAKAMIIAPGPSGSQSNDDYLDGGTGDDSLDGGSGDDLLFGGEGADSLVGGTGDDLLDGGTGIDIMAGGTGNDIYYVDGYKEVTVIHGGNHPGQGHGNGCGGHGHERPKGNEGVGNGCDPPPPGHDHNCNDGSETAPGQPGMQGGNPCGTQKTSKSHNNADKSKQINRCSQDMEDCGNIQGSCTGDSQHGAKPDHQSDKKHGCYPHKDHGDGNRPDGHGGQVIINYVTDTVTEEADSGYDVVFSSITYSLTDNVEELYLIGTENLDGTGNDLDNWIVGNDGDNRLDGGLGSDWLFGGLGNDTYLVDNSEDSVKEGFDEGDDRVEASCDYVLSENLETLALQGNADLNGSGNQADNELIGNAGANLLQGLAGNDTLDGGSGNDILEGGAGDDLYLYSRGSGRDVIRDDQGENRIRFGEGITVDDVVVRLTEVGDRQVAQIRLRDEHGSESNEGLDVEITGTGSIPTLEFDGGTSVAPLDLLAKSATWYGSRRHDCIRTGEADDVVYAGAGKDRVGGGLGNDLIFGESGADKLAGEAGHDQLFGGAGRDSLYGGFGNDMLVGGLGNDLLNGGEGSDLYLFEKGSGHDQVVEAVSGIGRWVSNVDDDVIRFGEGINKQDVALLSRWGSLQIGYGEGDQVDVMSSAFGLTGIERIELADGSYLTDADVNQLIQQMAAFAVDEGIAMNSLDDVRKNQELMTLVANVWHAA